MGGHFTLGSAGILSSKHMMCSMTLDSNDREIRVCVLLAAINYNFKNKCSEYAALLNLSAINKSTHLTDKDKALNVPDRCKKAVGLRRIRICYCFVIDMPGLFDRAGLAEK